jgi:hypothetical protein
MYYKYICATTCSRYMTNLPVCRFPSDSRGNLSAPIQRSHISFHGCQGQQGKQTWAFYAPLSRPYETHHSHHNPRNAANNKRTQMLSHHEHATCTLLHALFKTLQGMAGNNAHKYRHVMLHVQCVSLYTDIPGISCLALHSEAVCYPVNHQERSPPVLFVALVSME